MATHDDVVAFVGALWQRPGFNARVRLGALLVGCIATAAATSSAGERGDLARRGDAVVEAARAVASAMRSPGPEGRAWALRLDAEARRLHWLAGVEPLPSSEDLIASWRDVTAAFEEFGHVYEAARSRARLAAALAAAGDQAGASGEAEAAREVALRLGAGALLDELKALAGPAPDALRRAPRVRDLDALTPREREVLELVATGRSNREIASTLFISPKTVSVHISNLLDKLEAGSRTEAVAVARRRGLLTT
jgi:DNA-binding CsgD family transcriptional regulator